LYLVSSLIFSGRDEVVLWISVHPNVKLTFHRGRQEYVEFYHQPPGLCFHRTLFRYIQLFLGAIAFEKRLLVLLYPSVCPFACIRATSIGQTVVKFRILDFSLRFIRTSLFRFKSHRNNTLYIITRQSHWPRGLRRGSAAARLLGFWVRIPLDAWMSVYCDCCVLSGRGLCVGLITFPEESYRLLCVVLCDLETS
jgi:hypothetical protein